MYIGLYSLDRIKMHSRISKLFIFVCSFELILYNPVNIYFIHVGTVPGFNKYQVQDQVSFSMWGYLQLSQVEHYTNESLHSST